MTKKFKIYITIASLFILGSCSVAGSWFYERADSYLADYFKEFANFSNEQKDEIDKVTKNYLDWFTENELPAVRDVLVNLKDMSNSNANDLIEEAYVVGQELFTRSNKYFEKSFIEFFKSLTDLQVSEIKAHFEEIRIEREESRRDQNTYPAEVSENYISGFRRLNIKLTKPQRNYVNENIEGLKNIRADWSAFQEKWVEELIGILEKRNDQDFEIKITAHLRNLESLGDEEFLLKRKNNEQVGIKIISGILANASEKQMKGAKRRIDTYIASIDRILSNRVLD